MQRQSQNSYFMAFKPMSGDSDFFRYAVYHTISDSSSRCHAPEGEKPVVVHRLSNKEVMMPTHSEVMKKSCVVSPCAFDNGASYYKETLPWVSKSSKVEAFERLILWLLLLLSRFSVWLCATPRTAAHQAPLSMDSPGKDIRVGCHFLLQGDLPNPGVKPTSPRLAGRFFTTESLGKPWTDF